MANPGTPAQPQTILWDHTIKTFAAVGFFSTVTGTAKAVYKYHFKWKCLRLAVSEHATVSQKARACRYLEAHPDDLDNYMESLTQWRMYDRAEKIVEFAEQHDLILPEDAAICREEISRACDKRRDLWTLLQTRLRFSVGLHRHRAPRNPGISAQLSTLEGLSIDCDEEAPLHSRETDDLLGDLGGHKESKRWKFWAAVGLGNIAKVDILKGYGQDVGVKDDHGTTPMHIAAGGGQLRMVDHLRRMYDQDVGVKDNYGTTLMHFAAGGGHLGMVDQLKNRYGQVVGVKDNRGATPMHYAAESGQIRMVDHLRNTYGQNIVVMDNDGSTPLDYAIHQQQTAMVSHLKQLSSRSNVLRPSQQGNVSKSTRKDTLKVE